MSNQKSKFLLQCVTPEANDFPINSRKKVFLIVQFFCRRFAVSCLCPGTGLRVYGGDICGDVGGSQATQNKAPPLMATLKRCHILPRSRNGPLHDNLPLGNSFFKNSRIFARSGSPLTISIKLIQLPYLNQPPEYFIWLDFSDGSK